MEAIKWLFTNITSYYINCDVFDVMHAIGCVFTSLCAKSISYLLIGSFLPPFVAQANIRWMHTSV